MCSRRGVVASVVATVAGLLVPVPASAAEPAGRTTTRISITASGGLPTGDSFGPSVSAHGRYVAFTSQGSNLLDGPPAENDGVYVRDRLTGRNERMSLGMNGTEEDRGSVDAAISDDGRRVAFMSLSTNLVLRDTNQGSDVFVRDRQAGTTTRVSVSSTGAQAQRGSSDQLLSYQTAISGDGRYVAFASAAANLVPGDTNGTGFDDNLDVFVHDLVTRTTARVSVGPAGLQSNGSSYQPALSGDGRYVAFESTAANLVAGDTNGAPDAFVYDRLLGTTERVSVGPGGRQGTGPNPSDRTISISDNGRFVVFTSTSTNLVPGDTNRAADVFLHDRRTRTTERVSIGARGQANGVSRAYKGAVSADGRNVVFGSEATNLLRKNTTGAYIFLRDRTKQITRRVSVPTRQPPPGAEPDICFEGGISADGGHVAFTSNMETLVPGRSSGFHIYARDDFADDRAVR
jgi:Tol biopolymer transport system component